MGHLHTIKTCPCKTFIAVVYTDLTLRSSCHSIEKVKQSSDLSFPICSHNVLLALVRISQEQGILREQNYSYF